VAGIKESQRMEDREMWDAFCGTLISFSDSYPDIIVLDCDLSNFCGTKRIYHCFPERAFDCGNQAAELSMPSGMF